MPANDPLHGAFLDRALLPPVPPPSFRFVIDTHPVCTGADGVVRWEADTVPVSVAYEDLSPELKIVAAKLLEGRRGRHQ